MKTLLRAGIKRHLGGLFGIFFLTFLSSLALGVVLTLWINAADYENNELERAGFGALTAWVSNVQDLGALKEELDALPEVEMVDGQPLIFSEYEIGEQESDSEGQLILYEPGRYRFFADDQNGYREEPKEIEAGTVAVSPSLVSMFGVGLGDEIVFPIARGGGRRSFTVAGFYEDPFMGSSMIGMKGFLISKEDFDSISEQIAGSGIDGLARTGAMLHIFGEGSVTVSRLNSRVNETSLQAYTEFVHSKAAIAGFMLVLQNAFSGLLLAFVLVLLLVVLIVLGHSIGSSIESDAADMGALKTVGYSSGTLRRLQMAQYGFFVLLGLILGLAMAPPVSIFISGAILTTVGVRTPTALPVLWCVLIFAAILALLLGFIYLRTGRIAAVKPVQTWQRRTFASTGRRAALRKKNLSWGLALRQLMSNRRSYIGAFLVALLLAFIASLVGRMDAWLGPDGKGMMDAFNPADHDLGVQLLDGASMEEAEGIIAGYSAFYEPYDLAMPGVAVNGMDYTANVITQPERFHILDGRSCFTANEIVLTEFVASDLGVSIGDAVTVTGDSGAAEFTVSGIYSCANDLGDNVGLSREGYLRVGRDSPQLWCHHYFLREPDQKAVVREALEKRYGGAVHVHENTWPGLFGIISAMRALMVFLYVMVTVFVLVVTAMTGNKLLAAEQKDLGIFLAIGFRPKMLRESFALRFGAVALLGSLLGAVLAALTADPLVSAVMKLAGISNFSSGFPFGGTILPVLAVTLLFFAFAWLAAGKIRRVDLTVLTTE